MFCIHKSEPYGYEKTVSPALEFWGLSGIYLKFFIESTIVASGKDVILLNYLD